VKLLLDTHIWIWSLLAPDKLSDRVAAALESADNEIWLSPITLWELLILVEKGRIVLDTKPAEWIEKALSMSPVQEAPLNGEVALRSRSIDLPHQDPADRFLAATAVVYGLTLVTGDEHILESKTVSILSNR
jgi:PIN domain nuclease of toxin-antitoxin system